MALGERDGLRGADAALAPAAADAAPPEAPCAVFHAELIEGRGYRAPLALDAVSRGATAAEAARYAAAHGYRLGAIRRCGKGRPAG